MKLLDAGALLFQKNTAGGLSVSLPEGTFFETAHCAPLFPISDPDRFISIQAKMDAEYKEIGIVPDIRGLAPDQQRLVRDDIRFRYFVPEILDIVKIAKKKGRETWRVITDMSEKTFSVTDKHENILVTDKDVVFITDTDRFRYKISAPSTLPSKARILLDKNLL